MPVAVAVAGEQLPSTQPFQCLVCRSRFTRHENLKRHAALHTRSADKASYSCELCPATFSRRDLCTRHMRRKHAGYHEAEHSQSPPAKRIRTNSASSTTAWSAATGGSKKSTQGTPSILGSSVESHRTWPSEHWDADTQAAGNYLPDSPASSSDMTGGPTTAGGEGGINAESSHSGQLSMDAPTSLSPFTSSGLTGLDLSLPPALSDLDFSQLGLHLPAAAAAAAATPWDASLLDVDPTLHQNLPESLSPRDRQYLQDDWSPTSPQVERGLQLYFTYVSHFVPFLHRPTFDAREIPGYLVLSMLCLGYQHGEDPVGGQEADSGAALSRRCFHRARVLVAVEESMDDEARDSISLVQAYLLLEICAVVYLCGADSAYGLKMHPRMISLTRSSGLTQPPRPRSGSAKDLAGLWAHFRRAEAQKRTVLAAHQMDALWYQLLSIPRSLSHLEIKLELPCAADSWGAGSAEAWAYLELTSAGRSAASVQYSEAVRHFLSPEAGAEPLPPFDPFGAINIAQFLLSSAREVSGWSAMTGRLSLERLEPLRASLVGLAPYLRGSRVEEATWEIAMIELQIWSPSHTCGIVEGSVDAVVGEWARLAAAGQLSLSGRPQSHSAQPHVDWFLRYLDAADEGQAGAEAPWTALYAFKAFLIAWQLLRKHVPGAMQAVGVADGDTAAALAWARNVFGRRRRRRVGDMIVLCLDVLEEDL